MDKKHQKCPQNGFFPQVVTPKILFKNRASSMSYPYGTLIQAENQKKTNEPALRSLQTDRPTDGQTRVITEDPFG